MPWFNIGGGLHSHPKARAAGLEAVGLWLVCGTYSVESRRPGFVPADLVTEYPKGKAIARRLVKAGLWVPAAGGWVFEHEDEFWTYRYRRVPVSQELREAVYARDG